jgi:hypothetical protein
MFSTKGKLASEILLVLKSQPSGAVMPVGTEKVPRRMAMTGANVGLVKM